MKHARKYCPFYFPTWVAFVIFLINPTGSFAQTLTLSTTPASPIQRPATGSINVDMVFVLSGGWAFDNGDLELMENPAGSLDPPIRLRDIPYPHQEIHADGSYHIINPYVSEFSEPGTYRFRFRRQDGALSSTTSMVIRGQPSSLRIEPASVTAGSGTYTIIVGHGTGMQIDFMVEWPDLSQSTYYGLGLSRQTDGTGRASFSPVICSTTGTYTYINIRNSQETAWVPVNASIIVQPPTAAPTASITPPSSQRGAAINVIITGSNLHCARLSTTYPGLTISNVLPNQEGTQVTATFNLASAQPGIAPVSIVAAGGSTSVNFTIAACPGPAIDDTDPTSGRRGGILRDVAISGSNLVGGTLSSNCGIVFANVRNSDPNRRECPIIS